MPTCLPFYVLYQILEENQAKKNALLNGKFLSLQYYLMPSVSYYKFKVICILFQYL